MTGSDNTLLGPPRCCDEQLAVYQHTFGETFILCDTMRSQPSKFNIPHLQGDCSDPSPPEISQPYFP